MGKWLNNFYLSDGRETLSSSLAPHWIRNSSREYEYPKRSFYPSVHHWIAIAIFTSYCNTLPEGSMLNFHHCSGAVIPPPLLRRVTGGTVRFTCQAWCGTVRHPRFERRPTKSVESTSPEWLKMVWRMLSNHQLLALPKSFLELIHTDKAS